VEYFEEASNLKASQTPEQDLPAFEEWRKSQREWLMEGLDKAVEQYTLGGKLFSMRDPMDQIDFLRTKEKSLAAGFTEEEWKQAREQLEESMLPALEKYMVASGATVGTERGASGLTSKPQYTPPQDPEARKDYWKNVLWNDSTRGGVNEAIERALGRREAER
jgi:hypothetical protein